MPKSEQPPLTATAGHLARLLNHAMNEHIAQLGVAPGQVPVLMCLWEQDGLNQRELYERVHIEQATMSNTLKRMERDSLIRRKADPRDRRSQFVLLTPKAKRLQAKLAAAIKTVNGQALGALKRTEQKTLLDLLDKVVAGMTPPAQSPL